MTRGRWPYSSGSAYGGMGSRRGEGEAEAGARDMYYDRSSQQRLIKREDIEPRKYWGGREWGGEGMRRGERVERWRRKAGERKEWRVLGRGWRVRKLKVHTSKQGLEETEPGTDGREDEECVCLVVKVEGWWSDLIMFSTSGRSERRWKCVPIVKQWGIYVKKSCFIGSGGRSLYISGNLTLSNHRRRERKKST